MDKQTSSATVVEGKKGRTHMARRLRRTRLVALAAVVGLGLTACGGSDIKNNSSDSAAGGKDCGDLRIAVNPWTGYVSNAHVIGLVAQDQLGCNVSYPEVKEEVGWQGMADGSIDTIVENWGHPDLVSKYIDQQKSVEDAGLTGNDGIIGWYVPPWMAEKYPDITDWNNLNKYADMFKTSESGGKGQLLDGDPSYVTNDEALVKNLDLNFQVVVGGSEAALIQSFKSAEENKTPLLAYFYEPQWFFSEMKLVKINLPPYTDGCDADAAKVNCDYPPYALNKLISTKFADSGSPAVDLIKNFQWTNDDQNLVSTYIAQDGMSPDDAAKKWIDDNQDKVDAWLAG
jgi:glycine betaine/proline transport system substrate-binding protein